MKNADQYAKLSPHLRQPAGHPWLIVPASYRLRPRLSRYLPPLDLLILAALLVLAAAQG